MSHVATVDLEVKDLDALAEACNAIGLELVRGQQTYEWYGTHVGDYPVPAGFVKEDLGKCDHAIRIPGDHSDKDHKPYEIGVFGRRDGRPGYTLMWDFWAGGRGLQKLAGNDCCNVKREYAYVVAKRQAMAQGFTVQSTRNADGSIKMIAMKG
jgi:hypothetical protein